MKEGGGYGCFQNFNFTKVFLNIFFIMGGSHMNSWKHLESIFDLSSTRPMSSLRFYANKTSIRDVLNRDILNQHYATGPKIQTLPSISLVLSRCAAFGAVTRCPRVLPPQISILQVQKTFKTNPNLLK